MSEETSLAPEEAKFFDSGGETPAETPVAEEAAKETETFVAEAAEAEKAKEPEPKKLVPLEALHEARGVNRDLRAQLAREAESRAATEKRLNEVMERLTPKAEVPSYDIDPITNINARLEQTTQQLQNFAQTKQQQDNHQQVVSWYQNQAAQFATQQKDFYPAYNEYTRVRYEEMSNQGLSNEQSKAQFAQEELMLAATAARVGMNPGQMIYALAQQKGYKPATEKAAVQAKSLDVVKKGVESSKSLEQVSGKGTQNLTPESLLEMSDEDLSKHWDKVITQ